MYERLEKVLQEKGISRNKLAKLTGIDRTDIYQAMKGDRKMYDGWKIRIAKALEMNVSELFDE